MAADGVISWPMLKCCNVSMEPTGWTGLVARFIGGFCSPRVTRKVHYLVIGEIGSRDWAHSSFGRKIEYAVELQQKGVTISIIPEKYWEEMALE